MFYVTMRYLHTVTAGDGVLLSGVVVVFHVKESPLNIASSVTFPE
jgi:hypothetical protein